MRLENFKTLTWADFFLYSIIDPRALMRRIIQREPDPFWLSFVVPAASALFSMLTLSLMGRQSSFFYHKMSYGWIFVFMVTIVLVFVYSSMVDAVAQAYGLGGRVKHLIPLINFSFMPQLFILPALYPFIVGNFAPFFFYVAASIAAFIWRILIVVQGISEMHSIDFGRALVIFILPAVALFVFLFLALIMLVTMIVSFLS